MSDLSHVDEETGEVRMVDVGSKPVSRRRADARGRVRMAAATAERLRALPKGDALAFAVLLFSIQILIGGVGGLLELVHHFSPNKRPIEPAVETAEKAPVTPQ